MGAQNAKSDMERYRAGYPGEEDEPGESENLRFYKGERQSIPEGDYIDNIHTKWWGKYGLLERHHGYIQWLFPIREHGMNYQSQKLQPHEIEAMRADPQCMERLIKSYSLILDFFGAKLKDRQTGELERSDNYRERYHNLNTSGHNYLRITRILKCLGEFGYEPMKPKFIEFFVHEVYVNRELRNIRSSLGAYWVGTIRDDAERARLEALIKEHDDREAAARGPAGGGGQRGGGYVGGMRRPPMQQDSSEDDDDEDDDSEEEREARTKKVGLAAQAAGAANPVEDKKEDKKDDDGSSSSPANAEKKEGGEEPMSQGE